MAVGPPWIADVSGRCAPFLSSTSRAAAAIAGLLLLLAFLLLAEFQQGGRDFILRELRQLFVELLAFLQRPLHGFGATLLTSRLGQRSSGSPGGYTVMFGLLHRCDHNRIQRRSA